MRRAPVQGGGGLPGPAGARRAAGRGNGLVRAVAEKLKEMDTWHEFVSAQVVS
jgi:hypothetical protein